MTVQAIIVRDPKVAAVAVSRGPQGAKGDPGSPADGYPSRATMAARAAPAVKDGVYLVEPGREGKFYVDLASNWTAAIAADTAQGVLVVSTADATKVYVRENIWRHFWDIRWFGALADDAGGAGTDNINAINAFLAAAAAVGKLRTNDSTFNGLIGCDFPGYYFCSALINLKTPVHLRGLSGGMGGVVGGSRIRFPAAVAGIVVNRSDTTGYTTGAVTATTGADGSILEGLSLYCGNGTRPTAGTTHGILVRARCTIENCYVTGFAGTGIAVYADLSSNSPFRGNADGFHVRGGRVQNCGVHGFHAKGDNSNAGEVIGLDTFGNGQWGFLDESFLGVSRITGQDAGNGAAAYVNFPAGGQVYAARFGQESAASTTQPGTNSNVWWPVGTLTGGGYPTWTSGMTVVSGGPMALRSTSIGFAPYAEGGQGPWQIGTSSLILGGLPGPNIDTLGPRIYANLGKVKIVGGMTSDDVTAFNNYSTVNGSIAFPGSASGLGVFYHNSSDGLVLYAEGLTFDLRLANKTGAAVMSIPTGTTNVQFAGVVSASSINAPVQTSGVIQSSGGGVGYATGAGGAVTQGTSKSTAVTLNTLAGQITMNAAALAAGAVVTFVVNNSQVVVTDTIILNLKGGQVTSGTYRYWIDRIQAGSFSVSVENRSAGSLSEALILNFAIVKSVAS